MAAWLRYRLKPEDMANTPVNIYVAGHGGMADFAIVRQLLAAAQAPANLITRTNADLDLTN